MSTITRYSDNDLIQFEALIVKKLKEAQVGLNFYKAQISELSEADQRKMKSLGDSSGFIESERLQQLSARQKKLIHHLENARLRIKNKVYGICRQSNELISKERLLAVPHATLSIKVKQSRITKNK